MPPSFNQRMSPELSGLSLRSSYVTGRSGRPEQRLAGLSQADSAPDVKEVDPLPVLLIGGFLTAGRPGWVSGRGISLDWLGSSRR